ncbi:MAG: IS110 family transposase [Gammaproteobacteria bacterium]
MLGVEATGGYHELLAGLAVAAGLTVFVLNPKDVCHYAKACGARAKTDRVDAALIARFVAHEHRQLHPYCSPTPAQRRLQQLVKRRAKLVALKGALTLSLQGVPDLAAELKAVLMRFNALLAKLDATLACRVAQAPATHAAQMRLQTIVGVGPLVSTALAITLERLPLRNADALIAFTGLDPRPCDSGTKRGRRRLSKRGPSELRRLLFNAAMSAAKTKTWKPFYAHYRQRGWPSTAALNIIARKIARTAWSMHHHGTTFNPQRLTQSLT